MSFVRKTRPKRSPRLLQVLAAILGSLVLFLAGVGAISSGYQLLFSDRVFPGIWMAGIDLSSLTPEQASAELSQKITYPRIGKIVFRDGNHAWTATPAELGMAMDDGASVQRAYDLGRQGGLLENMASQLNAWQGGLKLEPVILFDARVAQGYLQNIASQINQPVVEADLKLNGTEISYTPGQNGRIFIVDKTLAALIEQLKTFQDGEITLDIEQEAPVILDAAGQADSLRRALSAPLTLHIADMQTGDPGPWTIDPALLAGMLTVGRVQNDSGWQYQVSMNTQAIDEDLAKIALQVNRPSKNARFYFDDPTSQLVLFQPSETGRTLDVAATREAISQKLLQGEHDIPLVLTVVKPQVGDDATAASLGITKRVYSYTSYFYGSLPARVQNIKAASTSLYGLLIPPNSTFSMGEAIGDISLDNGYEEALIIYGGKTIRGVGGGVCQVSTTLFRTAFYAGYPIVERHEHAYRVYYYEQTSKPGVTDSELAGLDATVYFPLVDLKFTNDRPYWLLMETYPSDTSLTWKFYSGDDGRSVDVQNLGLRNVIPAPEPRFEENQDLTPGTCKQVDWPGDGADITVTRNVSRAGTVLFTDSIRTHYQPWQAVYQYGPGTENPQAMAADGQCH